MASPQTFAALRTVGSRLWDLFSAMRAARIGFHDSHLNSTRSDTPDLRRLFPSAGDNIDEAVTSVSTMAVAGESSRRLRSGRLRPAKHPDFCCYCLRLNGVVSIDPLHYQKQLYERHDGRDECPAEDKIQNARNYLT